MYIPTRYNSAASGPHKPGSLGGSLSASIPGGAAGGGDGIATGAGGWAAKLQRAPPGQSAALYEAVLPLQSEPLAAQRAETDGARRVPPPERHAAPGASLKPEGGMQLLSSSLADFPPRQPVIPTRQHPADHLRPEGDMAGRSATQSAFQPMAGLRPQLRQLEEFDSPQSTDQLRIIRPEIRRNPDSLSLAGEVATLSAGAGRQRAHSGKEAR